MLRFDGAPQVGDEVQQKLAKAWPKDWHYDDQTQPLYLGDEKMEFLCGNRLIDPPEVEGAQWMPSRTCM